MAFLIWLVATILCGILYRLGGAAKKGNWLDFARHSWVRDWVIPFVALIALWLSVSFRLSFWWVYATFWGLSGGVLSTYWNKLFGYDNHYAHGLGCGLAAIPLCWVIPWWVIAVRLVVCTVGMGLWSKLVKRDVPQEVGRGVLFIL